MKVFALILMGLALMGCPPPPASPARVAVNLVGSP